MPYTGSLVISTLQGELTTKDHSKDFAHCCEDKWAKWAPTPHATIVGFWVRSVDSERSHVKEQEHHDVAGTLTSLFSLENRVQTCSLLYVVAVAERSFTKWWFVRQGFL